MGQYAYLVEEMVKLVNDYPSERVLVGGSVVMAPERVELLTDLTSFLVCSQR